jgi:RNA polymerase sigma-70 factor, ECF subfamily
MRTAISNVLERRLLEAACGGDEEAFRRLVEPHRPALHAHCYRKLGSPHDADDALQDALLGAWRGLCGFDHRGTLRSWLYRIATNACIDAIARRPSGVLPIDYPPPAGGDWREPQGTLGVEHGDATPMALCVQREAVELAFIAALHLPARQRAVLVLREVLGFSATEVSESLGTTVASVNSALQRARKAVDGRLPKESQQPTMRWLSDERDRELVRNFVDAFERADVDAIVSLLAEEATSAVLPNAENPRRRDIDRFGLPDELAA